MNELPGDPHAAPVHWGAEALWQQLEPLLPGLSIEIVRTTSSTNSALLARARVMPEADDPASPVQVRRSVESAAFGRRAADVQPCLLVAEHQTGGRGRQGRPWLSSAGSSLTFSLGVALKAVDWSGLSLAVGVALCEALAPQGAAPGQPRLGLKWPNDIWLIDPLEASALGGRKLGGILIETVPVGSGRLVVIGIGLNVLPLGATPALPAGVASVQEIDPGATPPRTLARVALPLVQALLQFEAQGFATFIERFDALDVLRGQPVRTTQPDAAQGIAQGVSAAGALLVQTAAGLQSVSSGEVSVRPLPASGGPAGPC